LVEKIKDYYNKQLNIETRQNGEFFVYIYNGLRFESHFSIPNKPRFFYLFSFHEN